MVGAATQVVVAAGAGWFEHDLDLVSREDGAGSCSHWTRSSRRAGPARPLDLRSESQALIRVDARRLAVQDWPAWRFRLK
ncbi:MAG TPA: hypothetical protein VFB42_05285 [Gaiellaceae bacterium]|nr:hypothetical protein [Gaiellaceae bacterium]